MPGLSVSSSMDGQVHASCCHTSKSLEEMSQGTFGLYFGAPRSEGHLGNTSLSLLHLGHHVILFCMVRAMAEITCDIFQSHLVENILVPNHPHETLVL